MLYSASWVAWTLLQEILCESANCLIYCACFRNVPHGPMYLTNSSQLGGVGRGGWGTFKIWNLPRRKQLTGGVLWGFAASFISCSFSLFPAVGKVVISQSSAPVICCHAHSALFGCYLSGTINSLVHQSDFFFKKKRKITQTSRLEFFFFFSFSFRAFSGLRSTKWLFSKY